MPWWGWMLLGAFVAYAVEAIVLLVLDWRWKQDLPDM